MMNRKLLLIVVLLLLVISLAVEFREVKALEPSDTSDPYLDELGPSPNIQVIEDFPPHPSWNMCLHAKHRFPIDYSGGSLETGDEATTETPAIVNSETTTIPELPSALILPLFMVAMALALVKSKIKYSTR